MLLAVIAALPLAAGCSVGGVAGDCISTSQCRHTVYSGLCPGSSDIKCCVDYGTCTYGLCKKSSECSGTSHAGLCQGASDIQCCETEPNYGTCEVSGVAGDCQKTTSCDGVTTSGLCPGDSSITCCTKPTTCTISSGAEGTCIDQGACDGVTTSGLCPGASNIKCCTAPPPPPQPVTCTISSGEQGECVDESTCSGVKTSGLCPGASNIKCCTALPPPPPPPQATVCTIPSGEKGVCADMSTCSGVTTSGLCPGASNIKCCTAAVPAAAAVSCATKINSYDGTCMNVNQCTGGSYRYLCKGSSSTQCCVSLLSDATPRVSGMSLTQFKKVFTAMVSPRADALLPFFNEAMETVMAEAASDKACFRKAGFIAQVGHESAGLLYFEELASGEAYEGRKDLGNTEPGDGPRFKGRGPIQLTGRANYESAGKRLGLNLVDEPDMVGMPSVAFKTTVDYWMHHNLNTYADSGSESSFETLTRRINGGTNGLDDRLSRWHTARSLLGCPEN